MSHSEESHESVNYEDAGVSTWAGAKAVEGIKDMVRSTYSPQVVGDLGVWRIVFACRSKNNGRSAVGIWC